MPDCFTKIYILSIVCLVVNVSLCSCHDESTSSSESVENYRRMLTNQKLQYDGLPIEFPSRRSEKASVAETTELTTRVLPPLSRRYRRIYNPDETASIEEYPFLAALLMNKELWCGAVIIDTNAVLTAAHCLQLQYNNRFFREYVRMLTVRVGSTNATNGGEVLRVSEIFFHPNYKPQTLEFNFAVLKLSRNISFDRPDIRVDMIPYSKERVIPVDKKITFLGWGSVLGLTEEIKSILLQKVELPIYDLADCQEVYGRDLVTRSNFCAGYISVPKNVCNSDRLSILWVDALRCVCQYVISIPEPYDSIDYHYNLQIRQAMTHDAGGPAILDGLLAGILSFSAQRCDQTDHPAVFSATGVVASWLNKILGKT